MDVRTAGEAGEGGSDRQREEQVTILDTAHTSTLSVRQLSALVAGAIRLVADTDARGGLTVVILQLLQGGAVVGILLTVRNGLKVILATEALGPAIPWIAYLAALLAISGLLEALLRAREQVLSELVGQHVQGRIHAVTSSMPYSAFETPALYDALERAQLGARMGPFALTEGVIGLGGAVVTLTGSAVALLGWEPMLLPIILLAGMPVGIAAARGGRLGSEFLLSFTPSERERQYLADLLTSREAAKEVRVYRLADSLRSRWLALSEDRVAGLSKATRRQLTFSALGSAGASIILSVALAALVELVTSGRLTAAEAGAAGAALLLVATQVRNLGVSLGALAEAASFMKDLAAFLRPQPPSPDQLEGQAKAAPKMFDQIIVDNVAFTYPHSATAALRGVSLQVNAGEVIALVGENGSGKTTLAKLLCGLHQPSEGAILWDGVDTKEMDVGKLADHISVLFQDFQRYHLPARENVGFGRPERVGDLAAVRAAAARAGADEFLSALRLGYNTLLGPEFEGGTDLSGGQWQRVALARAFFRNAPLLVLDEPTAALDPRAERALFDTMRELQHGRTVVLISHRFSSVRSADRIYVLRSGEIVESGSHDELVGEGGLYAELHALQMMGAATLHSE